MMSNQLSLFAALPSHSRSRSVEDVQQELDRKKHEGSSCPCCGAMVRVYRRTIHAQMAAWLIELCRLSGSVTDEHGWTPGSWIDQTRLTARGGDYAKLIHWGLVEHRPKDPGDTARRTSGQWRPTEYGHGFAIGARGVRKFAHIYRGEMLGHGPMPDTEHGDYVMIRDCLAEKFDWSELWG